MDNRMTETINKIPGLANIPLLGKLFTSRAASRNNSELLVIVTPEVVRPIPAGQPLPSLNMRSPFLTKNSDVEMYQPGMDKTGPVPVKPPAETLAKALQPGDVAEAILAVAKLPARAVVPELQLLPTYL